MGDAEFSRRLAETHPTLISSLPVFIRAEHATRMAQIQGFDCRMKVCSVDEQSHAFSFRTRVPRSLYPSVVHPHFQNNALCCHSPAVAKGYLQHHGMCTIPASDKDFVAMLRNSQRTPTFKRAPLWIQYVIK